MKKSHSYYNTILIILLFISIMVLTYFYFKTHNDIHVISKLDYETRDSIVREIENAYSLIVLSVGVLFGLTAYFVNFTNKSIVEDSVSSFSVKLESYILKYEVERCERHRLNGDLKLTSYNLLSLNVENYTSDKYEISSVVTYYFLMCEQLASAIISFREAEYVKMEDINIDSIKNILNKTEQTIIKRKKDGKTSLNREGYIKLRDLLFQINNDSLIQLFVRITKDLEIQ